MTTIVSNNYILYYFGIEIEPYFVFNKRHFHEECGYGFGDGNGEGAGDYYGTGDGDGYGIGHDYLETEYEDLKFISDEAP